jgi:hypothetical protein
MKAIVTDFTLDSRRDFIDVFVSPTHPDYDPNVPAARIPTMIEVDLLLEVVGEDDSVITYSFRAVGPVEATVGIVGDAHRERLAELGCTIGQMLGLLPEGEEA